MSYYDNTDSSKRLHKDEKNCFFEGGLNPKRKSH